jgi:hypothetical protein
MSFGLPLAWAWVSACAVVVALYLLRRREREFAVSALFLWERIPPDQASRWERLRPRFDLLLFLQLLGVFLFAFALTQPHIFRTWPAGATVILMDASASMAAEGRAELAIDCAQDIVRGSGGPWAVISWAEPPGFLVPPTERREEALAGIAGFQPALSRRPPLGRALALLTSPWERIVVITDDPPSEAGVEVVALPPVENLGIGAFAVRPHPDGSGYQALVRVRNDTPRFQDAKLALRTGGSTYFQSRLLGPGAEETFVFPYYGPLGSGFWVELSPYDPFPWDNVRYFALSGPETIRVRWLGEEDRYVWAALSAAGQFLRTPEPPWDLTVAVRTELHNPPAGPALLVEAGSPEASLGKPTAAGPFRAPMDEPLVRHVSPEEFAAETVWSVTLPEGATVALWAGELPTIARWEGQQGRRMLLTVELARSNLPQSVDFPILLQNALRWLLPYSFKAGYEVGQVVILPEGAEVITPDGAVAGAWLPELPGLHEVRWGERTEVIAVNVPWEESLAGHEGVASFPSGPGTKEERPIWTWPLAGALVLLATEWALARRRGG